MIFKTFKTFFALILLVTIFTGCEKQSHTTTSSIATFLRVTEKHYSDDYKEKWIIGYNSSAEEIEEVRIEVEDAKVWNLIAVNKEYFVSYQGSKEKRYVLSEIQHVGDEDTLR
ncbi:hypothetical protein [Saccharibacillus sp. JS10]|uniref:hypothetical protein n=1 Tax=Saccharibacillus sp. JS10 TaxID=2950552 RepID=UPI00210BABCE|nr:hypothetical protein [Saccharibacillus sp. JS10]MCQ4088423.1 hypothetical protein [Saccharibacillus sp. JS10]